MTIASSRCVICGNKAKATCTLCGKLVCSDHYNQFKKICTDCEKGKTANRGIIK